MRASGILLPVFSLPSKYGIGCFSKEAYAFIDFLKEAGQTRWQILPLGPTGYGDSPYQSFSTFAGNPYFIDLQTLIEEHLLTEQECAAYDFGRDPVSIDYEKLYHARFGILRKAYQRFCPDKTYETFISQNTWWLSDYALYMAVKDAHDGMPWSSWETPLRTRQPDALRKAKELYADEIGFYSFLQFTFDKQWTQLKAYANKNAVQIIGDLPIYVAFDSADTWAAPNLFQFTENHTPVHVAGCPPDAFSATGQLWGNPLYNWQYHKETDYAWWTRRIAHSLKLYDIVRIDHFRGFDEYYAIPYGDKTAEHGQWMPGPGLDFFRTIEKKLGQLPIIAEDLGFLTDSVLNLLKDSGFPGMKVIQFAFDDRESSNYLPYTYPANCVVYTGTHDNDTTRSWYRHAPKECRDFAAEYLHKPLLDTDSLSWDFIAMAMSSVANLCVIPIQDCLCLDEHARINTPSTLGSNWTWRLTKEQLTKELAAQLQHMTKLYGRLSS